MNKVFAFLLLFYSNFLFASDAYFYSPDGSTMYRTAAEACAHSNTLNLYGGSWVIVGVNNPHELNPSCTMYRNIYGPDQYDTFFVGRYSRACDGVVNANGECDPPPPDPICASTEYLDTSVTPHACKSIQCSGDQYLSPSTHQCESKPPVQCTWPDTRDSVTNTCRPYPDCPSGKVPDPANPYQCYFAPLNCPKHFSEVPGILDAPPTCQPDPLPDCQSQGKVVDARDPYNCVNPDPQCLGADVLVGQPNTGAATCQPPPPLVCPSGSHYTYTNYLQDCVLDDPITKTCPDGSVVNSNSACPPATKQCSDGSVVAYEAACPDSGTPGSATGTPGSTTGTPGSTTGTPGSTTGTPGSTTGTPGSTTGTPGSTTGTPGSTTGTPGSTTGTPGSTTGDCDPAKQTCDTGGTAGTFGYKGQGKFYTKSTKSVDGILSAFETKVSNNPVFGTFKGVFAFTLPSVSDCSTCDFKVSSAAFTTFFSSSDGIALSIFCADFMPKIWFLVSAVVKLTAVFMAVRIALTPTF